MNAEQDSQSKSSPHDRSEAAEIEKALERGMQLGLRAGTALGRIELVLKLLEARFGCLPDHVFSRVHGTSNAGLDAIALRTLTARRLDEALEPQHAQR